MKVWTAFYCLLVVSGWLYRTVHSDLNVESLKRRGFFLSECSLSPGS